MLTFLRKIRKSLIESGSVRKYLIYGIGEILLVMIGILLALQVNNWNEWRKERKKEIEVLQDLKTNLERNLTIMDNFIGRLDQIDHSAAIIKHVIENKSPYSDTLGMHFLRGSRIGAYEFFLNFDGYTSLENAGFDIISERVLRDNIRTLYEVNYSSTANFTDYLKTFVERVQTLFSSYFYVLGNTGPEPIDYKALLSDKKYISELNTMSFLRNQFKTSFIIESYSETQRVLQLINEELGD